MKNVAEEFVKTLYRELRPGARNVHDGCPVCEEDVLVYALNRVTPQYVSTHRGEVLSRLEAQVGQNRTDATVAIMEGFRFVAANPRCGRTAAS